MLNQLNVRHLSLDGLKVDQRLFDDIESLRVKYFDLARTNIGDEGLACLARVCNSGAINGLCLQECPITAAGLAPLTQLTSLTYLGLSSCPQLGDDDWATVPVNLAVQQLSIENADLSDKSVSDIVRVFPNVTYLYLSENNLLTDDVVDVLKQMPGLHYVTLPEESISQQKIEELEQRGIEVSLY